MKKLIVLILVLALLIPSAVFAADGDSPFFGKWSGVEHHAITHFNNILHFMEITKYKTCEYFVFNLFSGGGMGQGKLDSTEIYSGKWEIVDDHLRIPTSAITFVEVFYDPETDTLYTDDPKVTYVRLP